MKVDVYTMGMAMGESTSGFHPDKERDNRNQEKKKKGKNGGKFCYVPERMQEFRLRPTLSFAS